MNVSKVLCLHLDLMDLLPLCHQALRATDKSVEKSTLKYRDMIGFGVSLLGFVDTKKNIDKISL